MSITISTKKLIYIQIIYNLVVKFLIADLHLPSLLNYGTDAINLLLLVTVFIGNRYRVRRNPILPVKLSLLLFLVGTVSFVIDFSTPVLYIWSIRNVYRFFVFYYCCLQVLNKDDIPVLFELFEKALIINGLVCCFEFFVRHVRYDFLGGLFGNGITGGNGPLNALMVIASAYVILAFIYEEKKLSEVILVVGICLFIAVVGELKFYFFELIFILAYLGFFVTKNFKMVGFMLIAIAGGLLAINLYTKLYPNNAGFLSVSFIQDYAFNRTYGSSTEINRLTAIQYISENIFKHNVKKIWVGLGFGNGETAQYSFLTSEFYSRFGGRLKYNWFSHAFMFVEAGLVGVGLYFSFFITTFIKAYHDRHESMYMHLCAFLTAEAMILLVYNQTLRIEAMGYAFFAILAMPYVHSKEGRRWK